MPIIFLFDPPKDMSRCRFRKNRKQIRTLRVAGIWLKYWPPQLRNHLWASASETQLPLTILRMEATGGTQATFSPSKSKPSLLFMMATVTSRARPMKRKQIACAVQRLLHRPSLEQLVELMELRLSLASGTLPLTGDLGGILHRTSLTTGSSTRLLITADIASSQIVKSVHHSIFACSKESP